MSGLEDLVTNVQNFSSQGQWSKLSDFMNKSWNLLSKHVSSLDTIMETLDIQEHSLGILYILCTKTSLFPQSSSTDDFELLLMQCDVFISQCKKEQIQCSSGNFAQICHSLTSELCKRGAAIRGINIMVHAIEKIQETPSQLTSIHADLCQLCLAAKCLKPALKYLDIEITDVAKENKLFNSKHYLSYYYYGGMVYTAYKNYKRALFFFEQALACPATTISLIMVEAFKKHTLVSLIQFGKVLPLPNYTSYIVNRGIKTLCSHYNDLVTAYSLHSAAELISRINWNRRRYIQDKNLGLVQQVLASSYKHNIQMLTKTFITLSLSDVASRAQLSSPQEAESYLRNMIDDGEIFAIINQKDGMVSFYDDPEKYDNAAALQKIDKDIQYFMELDRKVQEMDADITVNPQYVRKNKSKLATDDDIDPGLRSVTQSHFSKLGS